MASSNPSPPPGTSTGSQRKVKSQAFEDAYRRFFESLSPKEQLLCSPCASHDDFIDAMRKLEEVANKRRKRGSSRFLDRIARLSDQLKPFFGVVNIMIQSNPEYTALVWGSLRLILQLASGFNTFFEKLIKTLERFCNEVPQYEDIQLRADQISVRIKECTEKVYGHMFQFFGEVANVFTSGGRIKRTPVVIAEILWKPFENRFDGLLKQVQSCRSLIEFDIRLAQARTTNKIEEIVSAQKMIAQKEQEEKMNAQKKADELAAITEEIACKVSRSNQEQLFERIQKWLSPPQYSDALFHGKSLREPGTNEWILTNPQFCEWREREWAIKQSGERKKTGPNILWVKGNAGSGKSILASSIIDELKEAYSQGRQKREVCYYFFTNDGKGGTTRISAYRSILAQILHRNRQNDEVIDKFDFIMTDPSSSGTLQAGLDELFELVQALFLRLQIFLILDGIDECEDNSSLIGEIMMLSESSSAKILLCGRTNTASLIRAVPANAQICLDRDTVSADIRLFISTQVDLLLDDELLPPDLNSEHLVDRLCRGADGMFLWAKLMFQYLRLPVHDSDSRLKVIYSVVLPEGLEKMYVRIVDSITQSGKTSRDFARSILTWASCSMRPLTLEELYDQMKFETSKTSDVDAYQLEAFRVSASIVCGGLIEFFSLPSQPTSQGDLRYIHLSVKEYFSQVRLGPISQIPLVGPEAAEHLTCAIRCLEYLLYHVSARQRKLGHSDVTNLPLGKFSGYAASKWLFHLDQSFASASFNGSEISSALMRLAPKLSNLLQDSIRVKFWIHILYSNSSSCERDGLASCLDRLAFTLAGSHCLSGSIGDLSKTMQRFCEDISKALNEWDKHLSRSTDILWDEMVIFSDSPFMAGHLKGQIISMAPNSPPRSIYPDYGLIRKISHTGIDGETTAVVSAWQNPHFPTKSVVKYELWKHNTIPTRLSEITIPIEHQTAFNMYPISISDGLGSFIVMDRLFVLVPNRNEAPISTCSTKIPAIYETCPTDLHTTLLKLSPQGRFLLMSQSSTKARDTGYKRLRDCTRMTMFKIEDKGSLEVKPIIDVEPRDHKLDLSEMTEAIFHPSYPVVIIRGETWFAAWNFAKQIGDRPDRSFHMLHFGKDLDKMAISSCGKYVILERWSGKRASTSPRILSIPHVLLEPGHSDFTEMGTNPRSDLKLDHSAIVSLLSPRQGDSALQTSPGRQLQSSQTLILAKGTPAQLISVQGGDEVRITRTDIGSERTDEAVNIIRLPQGQGMNEVTPVVLAPAPGDESVRIILNEKGQGGEQQPNKLPIFISRDINAIKHTFYGDSRRHVDGPRASARQQIRNRGEEPESEQVTKRRRTGTI